MEFGLAKLQDLPVLQHMYHGIVRQMYANGIRIWDDVYPCTFLEEDIHLARLYILRHSSNPIAAFALCNENASANSVIWNYAMSNVLYIDRLGVDASCMRQGVGSNALQMATETAASLGADALRLFVVDGNEPAIHLYEKCGFIRAKGVYRQSIDSTTTLYEYGYEVLL